MDDEREIIYIAIINSLNYYKELLESDINTEDKDLINYLISRHIELLDKYEGEIDNDEPKPISRPSW